MKNEKTDVTVNRNYKDTVFRKLFSEKTALLSLYNALFETNYDNPDELEIVTLENAIYMKHKDDLACIIDLRLALFEHQSSVNPNMPLRFLKYSVDLIDNITADQDIYSSKRILLPNPVYYVFYNGEDQQPERKTIRLSDSYMIEPDDEPKLELIVTQLNINDGFNDDLKQECPELFGYSYFVSLVRSDLKKGYTIENAVDTAIDVCIKENILTDFFKHHRKEVAMMSIYEFDEERHNRTLHEEGFEKGREDIINILLADGTITPERAEALRKETDVQNT